MGIKVAVIGGGSTYTPELIEGLTNRRDRLPIDELVLHDLDMNRLQVVGGLAQRMLHRVEWPGRLTLTDDAPTAVDDADFVLIQLRVGGQRARLSDETLPLEFDTIGQETTGAGGFAKALRTVPVVMELADLVRQRAAPDAWIVDFTNPVGIVTQALLDQGHRALGLCNVAIGFQRHFAEDLGVEPERVVLDHIGLNHLSWITAVTVDGTDRLPEILESQASTIGSMVRLPAETIRELGAVPSYYLRYYYAFDEVLAEQRAGHKRAEEVIDIERQLLAMYADPALDTKPELLNHRGGAFYSEAAAQLLASLHDGAGDAQVVDLRNGSAIDGLDATDVVEVSSRIGQGGATPLPQPALRPEMLELIQAAKAYEHLAISAAETGDRELARQALEANPLVGPRIGDVGPLLDSVARGQPAAPAALLRGLMPNATRAAPPGPTRMRREIGQIPAVVARVLGEAPHDLREVAAAVRGARPRFAVIAARGTSDHAANYAQYLMEIHLGLPTGLAKPSITTIYQRPLRWRGGLLLAISQSGQSPDIVAVVAAARAAGALTVAITNHPDSPLGEAAEHVLPCRAGRELAVPATKTYVAQLAVVAALVEAIKPSTDLAHGLASLPGVLRSTLRATDRWLAGDDGAKSAPGPAAVTAFARANRALVVSRGYNLATALELALKFKETCGLFAEAYSTADFAHGPVVLAGPRIPVLAIRPDGPMGGLVDETLAQTGARGGLPVVIGGAEVRDRDGALALPFDLPEALTPIVYAVPGQLLVEATARRRGISPDAPPGLGKVTRTR